MEREREKVRRRGHLQAHDRSSVPGEHARLRVPYTANIGGSNGAGGGERGLVGPKKNHIMVGFRPRWRGPKEGIGVRKREGDTHRERDREREREREREKEGERERGRERERERVREDRKSTRLNSSH